MISVVGDEVMAVFRGKDALDNAIALVARRKSIEASLKTVTGIDTEKAPAVVGGRIYCPYCAADHVWTCKDARPDDDRNKTLVRQAS